MVCGGGWWVEDTRMWLKFKGQRAEKSGWWPLRKALRKALYNKGLGRLRAKGPKIASFYK